ncbi:hypothetical protein AB1Y20_023373 [Prymnesium parvum]|uniref:SAP domain-containing protein n=1 Tax=Prymnesium parvum TaxID=97485 RepID=A0AB34JDQ1_PRYPA
MATAAAPLPNSASVPPETSSLAATKPAEHAGAPSAAEEEEEEEYELDDPRWLYSKSEAELRQFCKNVGLDQAGSHQELFERLVEYHEEYDDEGGDDAFEEEEFYRVLRRAKERHERGGKAGDDDGDSSEEEAEAARRQQAFAASRRQRGSVRNDKFRRSLKWKGRLSEAEKLKAWANEEFKKETDESTERALTSYLTAIWLLKPDDPPCPNALAAGIWAMRTDSPLRPKELPEFQCSLEGFEGVRLLGEGAAAAPPAGWAAVRARLSGEADEACVGEWQRWAALRRDVAELEPSRALELARGTRELRATLHLNVAAAALRFGDHAVVRAACEFVLKRQPEQPKALYRLAAAQAGDEEFKPALKTLGKLLALRGQGGNAEARKLLEAIRERLSS